MAKLKVCILVFDIFVFSFFANGMSIEQVISKYVLKREISYQVVTGQFASIKKNCIVEGKHYTSIEVFSNNRFPLRYFSSRDSVSQLGKHISLIEYRNKIFLITGNIPNIDYPDLSVHDFVWEDSNFFEFNIGLNKYFVWQTVSRDDVSGSEALKYFNIFESLTNGKTRYYLVSTSWFYNGMPVFGMSEDKSELLFSTISTTDTSFLKPRFYIEVIRLVNGKSTFSTTTSKKRMRFVIIDTDGNGTNFKNLFWGQS